MLFSNQKIHNLSVPKHDEEGKLSNIAFLVRYLCQNVMKDQRKELFVMDGSV